MKHQWSSGRIVPCHGTDPGSIPGWCMNDFAGIAQLGERQTEDLKVACSIHAHRTLHFFNFLKRQGGYRKISFPSRVIQNDTYYQFLPGWIFSSTLNSLAN